LIGAVDRYVSDFGTFSAIVSRYGRGARSKSSIPRCRGSCGCASGNVRSWPRPATRAIGEVTVESRNEAGNGIVADLL
jgi:hypothetical protein